jgi:hypothetical protein
MRDFWHFVNWINDESGDSTNKKLKPYLNKTVFKMTYKYTKDGSDNVINLDLWNSKYRDPNKPSYEKANYQYVSGQAGKSDLMLYQLGGGETAQTIDPKNKSDRDHVMNPRHVFNGIVVVRHKFGVKVIDAGGTWNENNISTWIKRWLQKPLTNLNKFYFECSRDDTDFKKILVVLVPHFKVYDAPVPAPSANWKTASPPDSTFNVIVTVNGNAAFNAVGRKIEVEDAVDKKKITRYLFGKTSAGAVGKNDLKPIGKWLKSKIMSAQDGTFDIKDLT